MKKLRFVPPFMALILAVSLSAFTTHKQEIKKVDGQLWFDYIAGDPADASSYFLRGSNGQSAPSCNAETQITCAVLAMPDDGDLGSNYPDLSDPAKVVRHKTQE